MSTTPSAIDSAFAEIEERFRKKRPQSNPDSTPAPKPKLHEAKKEKAAATAKAKQAKPAAAVSKPTKYLPTDRIAFTRQLDILRGWAAASGPNNKIVSNNDVAEIVKMQGSTVSMS